MAQKVQVLLVDDLDGSEATETVAFGLDGAAYEIDLSSGNAGKLRSTAVGNAEHPRNRAASRPSAPNTAPVGGAASRAN